MNNNVRMRVNEIYRLFSCLLILAILLPAVEFWVTESVATMLFGYIVLCVTQGLALLNRNPVERQHVQVVALTTYIVFSVFAIFHYCEITTHSLPVLDELGHYFPFVERSLSPHLTIADIWNNAQRYARGENYGFYFATAMIGRFGYNVLGDYSKLQVLLGMVSLNVCYAMILTKIIQKCVTTRRVIGYALLFMFFTPIVSYSYLLLRDSMIALLYICGIYIVIAKVSYFKGLSGLIIIFIVLTSLRLEHALFFMSLIVWFTYTKMTRYKVMFLVVALFAMAIGAGWIANTLDVMNHTIEVYDKYTVTHANQSGFAMRLLGLPSPIRQITCSILSQMFPLPPWAVYNFSGTHVFSTVFATISMLRTMVWFYIVFSTIWWLMKYWGQNVLGENLSGLLLIAVTLIILCSAEYYEARRIMCIYPIIYLAYIKLRLCSSRQVRTLSNRAFACMYGGLLAIYLLLL